VGARPTARGGDCSSAGDRSWLGALVARPSPPRAAASRPARSRNRAGVPCRATWCTVLAGISGWSHTDGDSTGRHSCRGEGPATRVGPGQGRRAGRRRGRGCWWCAAGCRSDRSEPRSPGHRRGADPGWCPRWRPRRYADDLDRSRRSTGRRPGGPQHRDCGPVGGAPRCRPGACPAHHRLADRTQPVHLGRRASRGQWSRREEVRVAEAPCPRLTVALMRGCCCLLRPGG
jgi:hypothetical protein